jgi:hypothetical protein
VFSSYFANEGASSAGRDVLGCFITTMPTAREFIGAVFGYSD